MPGIGDIVSALQSMPDPSADVNNAVAEFQARQQQGVQLQQQHAQLVRQLGLQRQADTAQARALADPTPENITRWAIASPEQHEAIQAAHTQLTSDQQNQNLRDTSAMYGYLQAGNKDAAKAVLQKRIDADSKAGRDTTDDTQMLAQIDQDPKAAAGVVGLHLAGFMGPDKFAEAYGKLGSESRATQEEPGVIAQQGAQLGLTKAQTASTQAEVPLKQAQTQQITNPRPETAVTTDAMGNPVFYNKNGAPPANGAAVSPDLQGFVQNLQLSENDTGDAGAKNPRSSATGNGQFLNGTWLQMVKAIRPDVASGKSDAEILALRSDPALSQQMTVAYAQSNAHALSAAKLPVNGATLAMAHKLGPGGAQAVLGADLAAPLANVLPANVIAANPQLKGLTAGQYAQGLAQKFGTTPIQAAPADPYVTGDDFLATVDPRRARLIKAIANGDQAGPTGRSAMTGAGQALMQQVLQYDPTASSFNLQTRQATRKAFTTGPEGQALTAANTLIGHLVSLKIAGEGLNSGSIPLLNSASNAVRTGIGDGQRQAAVGRFNALRTPVSTELTKVLRGSGGAESDVQGWLKQLSADASPAQRDSTISAILEAMNSRLENLGAQYGQGMGKAVNGIELLTPHARQQLALLKSGATAQAAGAAPKPDSIALLKKNPQLAAQFDQQYGPGAAQRYLGAR